MEQRRTRYLVLSKRRSSFTLLFVAFLCRVRALYDAISLVGPYLPCFLCINSGESGAVGRQSPMHSEDE